MFILISINTQVGCNLQLVSILRVPLGSSNKIQTKLNIQPKLYWTSGK